jgi:hypothetical protein
MEAGKPFGITRLRARGAWHAAHRKGPRHRRGNRRPHHGARPASRLDAVEKEALHRLAMMDREGLVAEERLRLVGPDLAARQPAAERRRACRRTSDEGDPRNSLGHLTACCYSPTLGKYIGWRCSRAARRTAQRVHVRPAARPVRPRRHRQPSLLRSGREAHAWLSSSPRSQPVWSARRARQCR